MAALLIKNLPPPLHERLRRRAAEHHRSMNREVIAILEKEIAGTAPDRLPLPVQPLVPVDGRWIVDAIRNDRDSRP
jgi:plasmid stability protein